MKVTLYMFALYRPGQQFRIRFILWFFETLNIDKDTELNPRSRKLTLIKQGHNNIVKLTDLKKNRRSRLECSLLHALTNED